MDKDDREFFGWLACAAIAFSLLFVMVSLVQASNEAAVFNKLTGGNATMWDALWADLRVIGEVERK
jgi:hypothetical protein